MLGAGTSGSPIIGSAEDEEAHFTRAGRMVLRCAAAIAMSEALPTSARWRRSSTKRTSYRTRRTSIRERRRRGRRAKGCVAHDIRATAREAASSTTAQAIARKDRSSGANSTSRHNSIERPSSVSTTPVTAKPGSPSMTSSKSVPSPIGRGLRFSLSRQPREWRGPLPRRWIPIGARSDVHALQFIGRAT